MSNGEDTKDIVVGNDRSNDSGMERGRYQRIFDTLPLKVQQEVQFKVPQPELVSEVPEGRPSFFGFGEELLCEERLSLYRSHPSCFMILKL